MRSRSLFSALVLMSACTQNDRSAPAPGVSWELAEERRRTLSAVEYDIFLQIPDAQDEPIRGRQEIRLSRSAEAGPLVLDFAGTRDQLLSVAAGGRAAAYELENQHLVIPEAALSGGPNTVTIEWVVGEASLNRNRDFLYTLFVPDRARFALPVFDQPNLKGRFTLRLEIPERWQAVANGALLSREVADGRATLTFAPTPPLPTYLFAFAAGDFAVEAAVRDGRTLRMLHRETDPQRLERNRDAIFDLHAAALGWLEEYTGVDYPFGKFDFVLVPSFQYGGMEHPGAILYRADRLLVDASATRSQLLGRASLIAHETAHMWFGDLVTMNWFDDVWMKEVFANFFAAKIVAPSFPDLDHDLRFLLAHYPTAYDVDRTRGHHPIRQPLANLEEAGTLYGPIIYQKAPIVMRQLEERLGEAPLKRGLRRYLESYPYGNAGWKELIEILDRESDEHLDGWSRAWVEEGGRPTVSTRIAGDRVAGDPVAGDRDTPLLVIRQSDPWAAEGASPRLWPQRLEVLLGAGERLDRITVDLTTTAHRQPLPDLEEVDFVLPNSNGFAYGRFELEPPSRSHLLEHLHLLEDPLTRAAAWLVLWEELLDGHIPADTLARLALTVLETEADELFAERLLADLNTLFWRFLGPEGRQRLAPRLEALLWRRLQEAESRTAKGAFLAAFRRLALSDEAVARLDSLWRRRESIAGLPLEESDEIALAEALAVRGVGGSEAILEEQLKRIGNPDERDRLLFIRPALSSDVRVRDAFFASLAEVEQRRREPWVLAALDHLHHPLRAQHSIAYLETSLELLPEIQRTGDIFFPQRWLGSTLGGHRSPAAAGIVRTFLDTHPKLSPRLRGKLLQAADLLLRAADQQHESQASAPAP